jgi:hypothetical protein
MGGYPAFGHHWHHYLATGPSLLGLVVPFLLLPLLVILLAAACRGWRRVDALLSPRKPAFSSARAVTTNAHPVQPMLASEVEREETARLISQAVGEGRLSIEEGGQRIDVLLRSRHRHELADLIADLPSSAPATTARPFTSAPLRLGLLAAATAAVLAAVLVQALAGLWELWPLAVVAVGASALRRR